MTIKGIVFDFDGLIIDTETPELKAWQELFESYGIDFPFQDYVQNIGMTYDDASAIQILEERLGQKLDQKAVFQEFKRRKVALIDEEPLCDGIMDYLESAREMGIKVGLASSAKLEWVGYHIKRKAIEPYFDVVYTVEDASAPKPDPALYTMTVETFGLHPNEVIALEDSFNGIQSAKAAGLYAVAVPNPVTSVFDFSAADLILESLTDISLPDLMQKFA
jgi:HAD superfamily hydrolase (TIGR01509 family)